MSAKAAPLHFMFARAEQLGVDLGDEGLASGGAPADISNGPTSTGVGGEEEVEDCK